MVKVAMTQATAHHDELGVTCCALSVVNGFAYALEMLLSNDDLRKTMGQNAYHVTAPYFTWQNRVTTFLEEIGVNFKSHS
jgi:spore maturation protein CgeB